MVSIGEQHASPATRRDRMHFARQMHGILLLFLFVVCVLSLGTGATSVSFADVLQKLISGEKLSTMVRVVMWDIRVPRLAVGILVGAALAVSGAVMQGLFRNPLADPGIVGVSAGASLGAVTGIVMTPFLPGLILALPQMAIIPVLAFIGAWVTMLLLYRISTRAGRTSVATMLLGGIGIGALSGAVTGIMIYHADDMQLRELTFWQMGSLTGSNWSKLLFAGPVIAVALAISFTFGRGLNGLALGEATAAHIGIEVQRLKTAAILTVAAAVGAAVAVSGGIGFIGIVVPHLLRLVTGPDHRTLLINSALLGASLLVIADVISRVIIAPAELPIGIVTAVLGAPVFIWILLRRRSLVDL